MWARSARYEGDSMTSDPGLSGGSADLRSALSALQAGANETSIVTELVHHSSDLFVVRAKVSRGDATRASAHAGASTVEAAEDAAILRAIQHLGLGSEQQA